MQRNTKIGRELVKQIDTEYAETIPSLLPIIERRMRIMIERAIDQQHTFNTFSMNEIRQDIIEASPKISRGDIYRLVYATSIFKLSKKLEKEYGVYQDANGYIWLKEAKE